MSAARGLTRGLVIAAAAGVVVFAGLWLYTWLGGGAEERGGMGEVAIGGPFALIDQAGQPRTDKDFADKLKLVYFGFTSCPDICPTELQTMANALDLLGPKAGEVAALFITVDPERDTVPVMKEYVEAFHERMVGLTGTPEQVAAVAKAYRVFYQKVKLKDSSLDYSVDHSGFVYLMGRDGKYLAHFRPGVAPEEIAKRVAAKL